MDKNNSVRTIRQPKQSAAILSLLSCIVARNGSSLSMYTSKKGRVWVTLVGTQPVRYTTSSEVSKEQTDEEIEQAMMVVLAAHIPKVLGETPPIATWITQKDVPALFPAAEAKCHDWYARWLLGEMFWATDYPSGPLVPAEATPDEAETE